MQSKSNAHYHQTLETFKPEMLGKEKKILVVEDERLICWSIANNLCSPDCSAICVKSAEEAIRFIGKYDFDLLIADFGLPAMTGLDLLYVLKVEKKRIPAIMITANDDVTIEKDAARVGVTHVLRKPFKLSELKILVKTYLDSPREEKSNRKEPPHRPEDHL